MKKGKVLLCMLLALALLLAGCSSKTGGKTGGSVIEAEDGYAEGGMGDTLRTRFFEYTVNSAYVCDRLDGYVPADGNELLVANVTVKNIFGDEIEMYDTDFQAQWNDSSDDAYSWPITCGPDGEYLDTVADGQLEAVYTLAKDEAVTGLLIFEVPAGNSEFSISYLEYFADDTTGDTFFACFTAEKQAAA